MEKINKKSTRIMLKKSVDLSYTSFSIINEQGTIIGKRIISKKTSYQKLTKRCEIGLSTVMVKSDIIKKFKFPEIKTQEDFGLWLKLLRNNYKFLGINTIYSSWRKESHSLSSNTIQKIIDAFKLFINMKIKI